MRSNLYGLAFGAMFATATLCSQGWAQDNGGGSAEEPLSMESTTETTTTMTTTTTTTGRYQTLKLGTKKVEITVPCVEVVDFDAPAGYRGVDDFFNVREANANVRSGQWELEVGSAWSTYRGGDGRDDDVNAGTSIKYGITDMLNVELEVLPINLGDGGDIQGPWHPEIQGDGAGELNFKLFWQFLEEHDLVPAMATWAEMRVPNGNGSEGVDGTLHLNMTKTVCEPVRWHVEGYITTANGARGDWDNSRIGDRRHFQWGLGTGFDYAINDQNLLVLNYMNRSSEYYGNANNNVIEAGWVHHLNECQKLLLGVDYADTHGVAEGPRWTGKVQWSLTW